MLFLWLD